VQQFVRKVQNSSRTCYLSDCKSFCVRASQQSLGGIESVIVRIGMDGCAVTRALSSDRRWTLRRQDLLKPDVVSEAIVLGAGTLVFLILIVILAIVLTHTSVPI
jgi:hypothetical protein